jgi:hypothetical protein
MGKEDIIKRLKEKSTIKYKAYDNTLAVFETIKKQVALTSAEIVDSISDLDIRIPVEYKERGKFEMELRVAADLVIMTMHSNIFKMPNAHYTRQSPYVKENPMRAYCGIINIYNFLADSFKFNRGNDVGHLIGRIFINHENHFVVEGKKQLGFLFNDFNKQIVDEKQIADIINTAILFSIELDLVTPPLDAIQQVSVNEMNRITSSISLKTGKRMGFRFEKET